MIAERLSKWVIQRLSAKGFKGIIPISQARKIRQEVLDEMKTRGVDKHDVTIDLFAIHSPGLRQLLCDCSKTKVTVKPTISSSVRLKK